MPEPADANAKAACAEGGVIVTRPPVAVMVTFVVKLMGNVSPLPATETGPLLRTRMMVPTAGFDPMACSARVMVLKAQAALAVPPPDVPLPVAPPSTPERGSTRNVRPATGSHTVHRWPVEQTALLLLNRALQSVSPGLPGQHSPGVHADPQHTS